MSIDQKQKINGAIEEDFFNKTTDSRRDMED